MRKLACPCCGEAQSLIKSKIVSTLVCQTCGWPVISENSSTITHPQVHNARKLYERFGPHGVRLVLETPGVSDEIVDVMVSTSCPVCGGYVDEQIDTSCDRCFWERSVWSEISPNERVPPNEDMSLNEARELYKRHGGTVSQIVHCKLITLEDAMNKATEEIEIPDDWMT